MTEEIDPPITPPRKRREWAAIAADIASAGLSTIPIAGGPIAGVMQAIDNHDIRKRQAMVEKVLAAFENRMGQFQASLDDALDLLAHAARVAPSVSSGQIEDGIANIVVLAVLSEPPQLDRAHVLIDIAAQLTGDHLRVLREIGKSYTAAYRISDRNQSHAWQPEALSRRLPDLEPVIEPLIAQLEAMGTLRDVGPTGVRATSGPLENGWALSRFGVLLLDHLDGREPTPDPRFPWEIPSTEPFVDPRDVAADQERSGEPGT